jgi:hypothetical protein
MAQAWSTSTRHLLAQNNPNHDQVSSGQTVSSPDTGHPSTGPGRLREALAHAGSGLGPLPFLPRLSPARSDPGQLCQRIAQPSPALPYPDLRCPSISSPAQSQFSKTRRMARATQAQRPPSTGQLRQRPALPGIRPVQAEASPFLGSAQAQAQVRPAQA